MNGSQQHVTSVSSKETGKWYAELTINSCSGNYQLGIVNENFEWKRLYYSNGGLDWRIEEGVSGWVTLQSANLGLKAGDVVGIAVNMSDNQAYFYKNGNMVFNYRIPSYAQSGNGVSTIYST